MDKKYLYFGIIGAAVIVFAVIVALGLMPHEPVAPTIYIVYASEKGDQSYTDSASEGFLAAQKDMSFTPKEFTLKESGTLPEVLELTRGSEKPGLVILIGFQYTNLTQQLAEKNTDISFLAIDMTGISSNNTRATEITSYGDSYEAGVLAASATKTGHVGIIMGMQTGLLDAFQQGYTAGVHAVNSSIIVDHAWVQQYSPDGFKDPDEAGRIAERMYENRTDVIYTCAGLSNTGAIDVAKNTTGLYIIGTDSDQSPLGPEVVLASAIKRVDRVVYTGIGEYLNGSFTSGEQVTGLKDGATGIVYNPKFAFYNETVSSWEGTAQQEEEKYLLSRTYPVEEHNT
ncbi:MAG: BMP family ABC transporter substrate-binding protein [Methanoregula sp.]